MATGRLMDSNAALLPGVKPPEKFPSPWLPVYVYGIALLGAVIIFFALRDLPSDWIGLLLFSGLAVLAQLGDVQLFAGSRSWITVTSIIAIASILLFGPMAGALVHVVSGVMTAVTTSFRSSQSEEGRVSWFKRTAFNIGMLVTATAIAGWTYIFAGGTIGNIWQVSNVLPLVAAVTVNALLNLVILIGVIHLQTGRNPFQIWETNFRWSAPILIAGGVLGGGVLALAYDLLHIFGVLVFFLPVLATSYSFRTYVSNMKVYVEKLEAANTTLDEVNLNLLETLGAIIDAYDVYTYGHSTQVATYTAALVEKMDIPRSQKQAIVKAALIHDLGKVGIMDAIISKPGPLTREEYEILKRHPVIGAEIIGRMKGLQELVPLVRHHHERWDGGGYPDGIVGEEIPLGARILALADSLDAMLSDRPYRPTRSLEEVVEEVRRCSGTQFDPQVVEAFFLVKQEKNAKFFRNSAAMVDKAVLVNRMGSLSGEVKYFLRKDMADNDKD